MEIKVLFAHGLASSGAYKMAAILRQLLSRSGLGEVSVIAPDLPVHPLEAIELMQGICRSEDIALAVGHSYGGFLVQKLPSVKRVLVNPSFHISRLMATMVGEVQYLSPRADGAASFTISQDMVDTCKELEDRQFADLTQDTIASTLAFFADRDERVDCYDEFSLHYPGRAVRYPGGHLPTYPQIKKCMLAPMVDFILNK